MPIKKSAKKYMKVSAQKAVHNKKVRGVYKSAIKKVREAITEKNIKKAKTHLKDAIKSLDKAAQKKVLKKNTAARYKSRLNSAIKKLPSAKK